MTNNVFDEEQEPNRAERRLESRLIGSSASFSDMLDQVSKAAPLNKPILVVGERGTGKELVAARIHYLSSRWQRSYHTMNCAAISESLIESELFGHEAGSFTGAGKRHQGRFERADGGSLFMDELATTSTRVQEQLLRIIEYGEFERLGGSDVLETDVRLIAATNEDLPTLAKQGRFRYDLLDRLSFDVITLPPLRHRQDDILTLAEHFASNMSFELGREYFAGFSERTCSQLLEYRWPGNIRELKNVIERSVYKLDDSSLALSSISFDPFESPYRPITSGAQLNNSDLQPEQPNPDQGNARQEPQQNDKNTAMPLANLPTDLKSWVAQQEREVLAASLEQHQYNQRKTAEALGLSYHQLRAYLRKYDDLLVKQP